jgi:hypothetical protein
MTQHFGSFTDRQGRTHRMLAVAAAGVVSVATCGLALGQSAQDRGSRDSQQTTPRDSSGTDSSGTAPGSQQQQQQQRQQAPEGFVLVSERVIYLMLNEPQQHFLEAAEDVAQKHYKGAAAEIRLAAGYLDMQASRTGAASQQLTSQADQLRQLADRVEQGKVTSPDELAQAFARANKELAQHHEAIAQQAIQQKKPVKAGHDLDQAAMSLEQALVWMKQKPEGDTLTAIGNARAAAAQLMAKEGGSRQQDQAQTASASSQAQSGQQSAQGQSPSASDPARAAQQLAQAIQKTEIGQQSTGEAQQAGAKSQKDQDQTRQRSQ